MILQGHPRSLISAPIESAWDINSYRSLATLVLFFPVAEILDDESHAPPYSGQNFGVFPSE